jgi:thioredoxin-related protein
MQTHQSTTKAKSAKKIISNIRFWIIIVVVILIIVVGVSAFTLHRSSSKESKSNLDLNSEQDLSNITSSLLTYGNKSQSLPTDLIQLNLLSLNNPVNTYKYNTNPITTEPEEGFNTGENAAGKKYTGFNLCANFKLKGLSNFPGYNLGDSFLNVFKYHHKGFQCFTYNFGYYGGSGPTLSPT